VIRRLATISRREFLQAGAVATIGAEFGPGSPMASSIAQVGGRSRPQQTSVKALVFDTFGTVVDWRTSVTQEVEGLAKRKGLTLDGAKLADAWRAGYAPSMNRVRTGELPWTKLDGLHRMILDRTWRNMRGYRGTAFWEPSSFVTTSPTARCTSPPQIFSTSSPAT